MLEANDEKENVLNTFHDISLFILLKSMSPVFISSWWRTMLLKL
jgi:hypothetical protein